MKIQIHFFISAIKNLLLHGSSLVKYWKSIQSAAEDHDVIVLPNSLRLLYSLLTDIVEVSDFENRRDNFETSDLEKESVGDKSRWVSSSIPFSYL